MRKILILFLILTTSGFTEYTLREGKLVEKEQVATGSAQEHYGAILQFYDSQQWKNCEKEALILMKNFSTTPYARDVAYFLGVSYFYQEDYELANQQFTDYLTRQATPKFFEEAIEYKFRIAEEFKDGARKHLMGFKTLPKWMPAGSEAIEIYEEVISALPHHPLAAQALYGKAQLLAKREDYRAAIESYQTLIRRFSKNPLAVESYIGIAQVYLEQSRSEYPDPDFLDLAELNLRKFKENFPTEEKIAQAQQAFKEMQDHYAESLYQTARFFERTNKLGAARIYYAKIIKNYPDAEVAKPSKERFDVLCAKLEKAEAKLKSHTKK